MNTHEWQKARHALKDARDWSGIDGYISRGARPMYQRWADGKVWQVLAVQQEVRHQH